jgi:hypothetical protein
MSEVHVPFGDKPHETATLLLAAAEDTETPVHLVRVVDGGFKVPEEVADSAGLDHTEEYEQPDASLRPAEDAPDGHADGNMLPADSDPEDNTSTPDRPGPAESPVEGTVDVPDNNDPEVSSGNTQKAGDDEKKPDKTKTRKQAAKKPAETKES